MSSFPDLDAFDQMSAADQIKLVGELWDRVARQPDRLLVSEEQLREIDRRVREDDADPDAAIPWEIAREQLLSDP